MRAQAPRKHMGVLTFFCAIALSGCDSLKVWNFDKAEESGVRKGTMQVAPYLNGSTLPKTKGFIANVDSSIFPNFHSRLGECELKTGAKPHSLGAALVPVVGKLLFDLLAEKQIQDLKVLKEASTVPYSATIVFNSRNLRELAANNGCLVIQRISDGQKNPDFLAILQLSIPENTPSPPATVFVFQPIYVSARSTVAVTKQSQQPAISSSFAITLKGIGKQENGLPTLALIGQANVTAPKLLLKAENKDEKCLKDKSCPSSDLIPLYNPTSDKGDEIAIALGVAVTETGDVGFGFDTAEAELKAIKEALGPTFKDILTEKLED